MEQNNLRYITYPHVNATIGRIWHLGKIEFSVDLQTSGKNAQFKIMFKSEVKVVLFLRKKEDT